MLLNCFPLLCNSINNSITNVNSFYTIKYTNNFLLYFTIFNHVPILDANIYFSDDFFCTYTHYI